MILDRALPDHTLCAFMGSCPQKRLNRQVLQIRESVLGKEHPNTLTSASNLTAVLWHQGKYEAARDESTGARKRNIFSARKRRPRQLSSYWN